MEYSGVRARATEVERTRSSMAVGAAGARTINATMMKLVEPDHSSMNWYFPREEIERSSPSRKDGIDLKKENYLRKSFCTFLQDLGMKLKLYVFSEYLHLFRRIERLGGPMFYSNSPNLMVDEDEII